MPLRLTAQQLAIMRLLWDRGEMTVAEVQESLGGDGKHAYSTVATMLGRLEKRGLVRHRAEGRTYHFSPAVSETGVVREVVDRVFGGSASALVSHLLENEELGDSELSAIKKMISEHERNSRSNTSKRGRSK